MDAAFLIARIAATKAAIIAYEDAILALATSNTQSYTLDTGQTIQKVTRADVTDMQATLDSLYNRLAVMEARLNGAASISRPAW